MKTFIAKPKSMTCSAMVIVLMLFANITRAEGSTDCDSEKYNCELGCVGNYDMNHNKRYDNCMNTCSTEYNSCTTNSNTGTATTSSTQSSKSKEFSPTSKKTNKQNKPTNSNKLTGRKQ